MRPPGVDQQHRPSTHHQHQPNNNNHHRHHFPRQSQLSQQNGNRYGQKQPPLSVTPFQSSNKNELFDQRRVVDHESDGGLNRHAKNINSNGFGGGHQQQLCHCCPYGFHIDLGFVKFAEDVAAGKEQIQNWSSPAKKRSRRLPTSPSSDRTMLDISETTDDGVGSNSNHNNVSLPFNDASILSSKFVEADDLPEMLDLRSALPRDRNHHNHHAPYFPPHHNLANGRAAPQSILKNSHNATNEWSDAHSNVPLRPTNGGAYLARSMTMAPVDSYPLEQPLHRQHQSRFFHQQPGTRSSLPHSSTSAPTPPSTRRFPLSIASDVPSTIAPLAGIGSPIRTSTPRTNEEIQQILSHYQPRQQPLHITTSIGYHDQHRNANNTRFEGINGVGATSAPTSPIPKNFHTAIAQSMAQLRKIPSKASASTSWNSTPQAHTSLATLSAPARNAFSAVNVSSSSHRLPYLEMGRRQRMLSPEPSMVVEPGQILRNSNLQSRAFFHVANSNNIHHGTTTQGRIPYRSRGASTPSLDLGDFASIRRRRLNADILGGTDDSSTVPSSALIMRSLSPPVHPVASPSTLISSTPHWPTSPPILDSSQFSGVQTPLNDVAYAPPPLPQQQHYDLTIQRPPAKKEPRLPIPVHAARVVRHSGTQTMAKPPNKEVGIGTERERSPNKKRHTKDTGTSPDGKFLLIPFAMAPASIGVDTSDLEPKKPPPPPPKPAGPDLEAELQRRREMERMTRMSKLSAEFQYCLGHEPEHCPGEQPQFLEKAERNKIDRGVDAFAPPKELMHSLGTSTSNLIRAMDAKVGPEEVGREDKAVETEGRGRREVRSVEVQTDEEEKEKRRGEEGEGTVAEDETQTDSEWLEAEIERRLAKAETERREKRKRVSVERSTETDEEDAPDQFIMITCNKCEQRSSVASDELFEKIVVPAEEQKVKRKDEEEEEEGGGEHNKMPKFDDELDQQHHLTASAEEKRIMEEEDLLLDLCVEEIAPIRGIDTIIEEEREEEEEEVRIQEYEQRHEQDEEQEVHLPSIIEGEERERKEEESSEEEDAITERVVEGPKKGSAGEDEGQRTETELLEPPEQQNQQNVSPLSSDEGLVLADGEEDLAALDGRDMDSDGISIETDVQTVICVGGTIGNHNRPSSSISCTDGKASVASMSSTAARTEALRKLLTEPQRYQQPFQRDAGTYRSYRAEKGKANDLEYITERHKSEVIQEAEPSTPCSSAGPSGDGANGTRKALKETIALKKSPPATASPSSSFHIPDPVPARIPRPKFSKYSPNAEHAETPDEEAEAADRLTPLRSEMRALSASLWSSTSSAGGGGGSPRLGRALIFRAQIGGDEEEEEEGFGGRRRGGGRTPQEEEEEDGANLAVVEDASSTSSEGARTYEMSEEEGADFELSAPLRDALETINENVLMLRGQKEATTRTEQQMHETEWAHKYAQHEWLKLATKKNANAELVEHFLDALETYSIPLMETVVNMTDQNGNTALHYAVSNENFDVVSVLLDSKVCRVDEMNKAGYSALMLGALCELHNDTECAIIQRLFQMGNVNAKAVKHAQTALMLAASHGRVEATNLLLNCGADVNIQDVDGSTALMCAAEHGQKEIVKILLKRPNIDASLTDCDNQTALSIAVENQHRDIGVLIYAYLNFSRLENNDQSVSI